MNKYRKETYPKNRGLFENNIIISKNNENSRKLLHQCWEEYSREAKRDQLALNYCSWKLNVPIHDLGVSNVRSGGRFFYLDLNNRFRKITFIHLMRLTMNRIYLFINRGIERHHHYIVGGEMYFGFLLATIVSTKICNKTAIDS